MTKVAVYGFGKVGKPLVDALTKIEGVEVKYVVTRTPNLVGTNQETVFTTEVDIPILDSDIEVIFECMTDENVAEYVINQSLEKLKTVISCSKRLWGSRGQDIKGNPELVLLNSLACNQDGVTDYPEINITLSNLHELDPTELYKFRGCDGACAASVMVQDFVKYTTQKK
jgi:hypothetical protein